MARLILVTGDDPHALLRAAAAPFCVSGGVTEPLPVLALRQGGLRDTVYEFAARSGCVGWLGDPVLVFAELAERFGGELAPLDALERETLIDRIVRETTLTTLGAPSVRSTLVSRLDRLFGDMAADEVTPQAPRATIGRAVATPTFGRSTSGISPRLRRCRRSATRHAAKDATDSRAPHGPFANRRTKSRCG